MPTWRARRGGAGVAPADATASFALSSRPSSPSGRDGGVARPAAGRQTARQQEAFPAGKGTPALLRLVAAFLVVGAVEGEELPFAFHDRRDVHRAPPDAEQRRQRVARLVELQIQAVVLVHHQELAAVLEVAVLNVDERLAEVRELEEELLLDGAEL